MRHLEILTLQLINQIQFLKNPTPCNPSPQTWPGNRRTQTGPSGQGGQTKLILCLLPKSPFALCFVASHALYLVMYVLDAAAAIKTYRALFLSQLQELW